MFDKVLLSRRNFLFISPTHLLPKNKSSVALTPIPIDDDVSGVQSDTVYVYRNDKFQALYAVSDNPPNECVTVKRRVDWYDPLTDSVKTMAETDMYIIGFNEI